MRADKKIQETGDDVVVGIYGENKRGGGGGGETRVLPFVLQGHTLSWRIIYRQDGARLRACRDIDEGEPAANGTLVF